MNIKMTTNASNTSLSINHKSKNLPKISARNINRAILHLRSRVDKNLATGKFKIKTRKGGLRASLATKIIVSGSKAKGILGTNLVYAAIQERGGQIRITDRMAKFAWAKWYETGLFMWKAIALSKGRHITIPAHWYMKITLKEEKQGVLRLIKTGILGEVA